jgi:hypothetical protein
MALWPFKEDCQIQRKTGLVYRVKRLKIKFRRSTFIIVGEFVCTLVDGQLGAWTNCHELSATTSQTRPRRFASPRGTVDVFDVNFGLPQDAFPTDI